MTSRLSMTAWLADGMLADYWIAASREWVARIEEK